MEDTGISTESRLAALKSDLGRVHIQQALSGLAKLSLRLEDLKRALFLDGSPATPAGFKHRFADYLPHLLKGRDNSSNRKPAGHPRSSR